MQGFCGYQDSDHCSGTESRIKKRTCRAGFTNLASFSLSVLGLFRAYVCFILMTFVSLRPVFGLIMACGCLEYVCVEMTSVLPLILHSLGHLCLPSPESGF